MYPRLLFPLQGYLRHEHIHTNFHKLEETTKAYSAQKDKIKHTLKISDIQSLRKNTEIQHSPVDQFGQDKNFTVLRCNFLN